MARFMRTALGPAHSRLGPPRVIGAGIVFRGLRVRLVNPSYGSAQRRLAHSKLRPPAVVGAGIVFRPVRVVLAAKAALNFQSPARRAKSTLRPPAVVNAASTFYAYPVSVTLAASRRGTAESKLFAPSVVGAGIAFSGPGVALVRSSRGTTKSKLSPPTVVNAATAAFYAYPVRITLAASKRGTAKSTLRPPVIPPLAVAVRVTLARRPRTEALSRLFAPAVVGAGIYFYPVAVKLVRGRAGAPRSALFPPAVVAVSTYAYPARVTLVRGRAGRARSLLFPPIIPPLAEPTRTTFAPRPRTETLSRLAPPAVVGAGLYFYPVLVTLAPPSRGTPRSRLAAPAVVGAGIYFYPVKVTTVRGRAGKPRSVLSPPVIPPVARPVEEELAIQLVRLSLPERAAHSRLSPPTVVNLATELVLSVHLALSSRGRPKSDLLPPAVVGAGIYFYPVRVALVRGRAGKPRSALFPPTVVAAATSAYPVRVTLVRGRAGHPSSTLRKPAVVGAGIYFYPVAVTLAPPSRGKPRSFLLPPVIPPLARPIDTTFARIRPVPTRVALRSPVVVNVATELALFIHLAPSSRGIPKSKLTPPAVVGAGIYFYPVAVTLAPSSDIPQRRRADSKLSPPTVVQPVGTIFYGPVVTLAPGSRGKPSSVLRKPAVIGAGIVFAPVTVTLSPSSRGKPRSLLFPPIIPPTARPIETEVAVQLVRARLERQTLSRLRPPTVVFVATELTIAATLTRIRPVATHAALRPPVVVYLATELTIGTTLVRITPPPTESALSPPTVVFLATELTIAVTLTRIRPVRTLARILPPVIPSLAAPTKVELARITPPPTHPRLQPPAVVGDGIYFYPVAVRLAPSSDIPQRRRPDSKLYPPAVVQAVGTTFVGPIVHLAPSSRGIPKSELRAPAVVGAGIVFRPVKVWRTYSRFGKPRSILRVGIVGKAPFRPVKVWLTRLDLTRRQPHPKLRAPARVGAGIVFRPLDVTLAPSTDIPRRRRTVADLKPPTVVNRPPAFLPSEIVALAPQSRGAPYSRLFPPAVVGAGVYFYPVRVKLAASSRGVPKSVLRPMLFAAPARPIEEEIAVQIVRTSLIERAPHSHLSPPTVVRQPPFRPLLVRLAPSTRGVPKSTLRHPAPPPPLARAIAVRLAPQSRGKAKPRLAPPTVVRTAVLHPVRVRLAQIRPVPTRHLLAPPTVVFAATELTIRITLAPSSRGKPVYLLRPPTVVRLATELTLRITLAPSSRGVPHSKLAPPAVVGQRPFAPIEITLVRIRPPHTAVRLSPPTVVTPYQPPLVTTLSIHLAVAERIVLGPRLATHTRLPFPPVIVIPTPGFTSGRSVPGGAAEGHDVPDAGGSAESKPRDRGESKDVASGGSTIRSVEGSAGEARDKRRPLT